MDTIEEIKTTTYAAAYEALTAAKFILMKQRGQRRNKRHAPCFYCARAASSWVKVMNQKKMKWNCAQAKKAGFVPCAYKCK